jgi:SAM-dependent methyltransferase
MNPILDHNRRAWDERVRGRKAHTNPATEKEFQNPLAVVDARGWLGGDVRGKRLLCLASGGGYQSVLFAAAGAIVTVVDISPEMLALDHKLADERGLRITTVEASMDDLPMLDTASFDIVSQPVSTCYVPDISLVYREVARLLAPGGIYVSQHKNPASLQADLSATGDGYLLRETYYRTGPLPRAVPSRIREAETLEFLHTIEDIVGGLCRAGFVIEDLREPRHDDEKAWVGSYGHRCRFLPPYVRIKARRVATAAAPAALPRIWTPSGA